MSYTRFVRGSLSATTGDPCVVGNDHVVDHRRRRSLPRSLVARGGRIAPRQKKLGIARPRTQYEPRLTHIHDFGDGRHALEFDNPSMDLVLYHDQGVTIAEWVTVEGELVWLVAVGDC